MAEVRNGVLHEIRQLCYEETGALIIPRELFDKLKFSEEYPIKDISLFRLEEWKEQTAKLKLKSEDVELLVEKLAHGVSSSGKEMDAELLEVIKSWNG